jgi:hypothetical protein
MILLVSFEKLVLDAPRKLQYESNGIFIDFLLLTNKPTDGIHHANANLKHCSVDRSYQKLKAEWKPRSISPGADKVSSRA